MRQIDANEQKRRIRIVNDDFNGMLPYNEAFYIHSILYSAEQCLRAFNRYFYFIEQENHKPEILISSVQDAIGHAAALSRYFWPSIPAKVEQHIKELRGNRGTKLRDAFGLNDNSPLFNRDLRNAWEHFDERLDTYLIGLDSGNFFPTCLLGSHTMADDEISRIFKLLDVYNGCLVLLDQKYFFDPIIDEVERIYKHCMECEKESKLLNYKSQP